jgi:hypothetical protein
MPAMNEMVKVSFDAAQLQEIKRQVTADRSYADRVSLSFAFQLSQARTTLGEDHFILDIIDGLENVQQRSTLRAEAQFRHPPLHPFWHVHWSAPRHIPRNIGIHWNLTGKGKRDPLTPMLQQVAKKHGHDPARWPGIITYRLAIEGHRARAERGLTGDWIIFGKHEGRNYYLALATHEEGEDRVPWRGVTGGGSPRLPARPGLSFNRRVPAG